MKSEKKVARGKTRKPANSRIQRIEEELRQSELLHETVLSNVSDAVFITDSKGRFTYICPNVANIFGYSQQEVEKLGRIGKLLGEDLFNEEELGRRGEIENIERSVKDKYGRLHHLLVNAKRVSIGAGTTLHTCRDITERKQAERDFYEFSEQQRTRIGQDLHDGLGQILTAIGFTATVLEEKLNGDGNGVSNLATEISKQVAEAKAKVRRMVQGMYPDFVNVGFETALRELLSRSEDLFDITCKLECSQFPQIEDRTVATNLYRIIQESISNAVRHGKAREIRIEILPINVDHKEYIMRIDDNGVGIPAPSEMKKGIGLRIMKYRAAMIGATLAVESLPDGGTCVSCRFSADSPETDNAVAQRVRKDKEV